MPRTDRLTITLDFTPIRDAFRMVAQTLNRAAELFTPQGQLRRRRRTIGGMGTDAKRWPSEWQSMVCAGLLCGITPCPSDASDLHCTHNCHRRK